jgi:PAS domain S-box-containing protein
MGAGGETAFIAESVCAREPIHIPGAIQPHGALLAVQPESGLVTHASANLRMMLGYDATSVLGRPLADILDAQSCHAVLSVMGKTTGWIAFNMSTAPDGSRLRLRAHRSGRLICVDIEPEHCDPAGMSALIQVQSIRETFNSAASCLELCELAVRGLKQVTGYDRVMAYRFAADGHGEVVAEALEPALQPYLGLHYPAGDIPAQARQLFLRHRVAAIADSSYVPVPIFADAALDDGTPLDLTQSGLRSVSAMHCEYMRNMQTAASLTVALVHEEALWGMLVCHHTTPRVAGPELRAVADSIGHIVSSRLADVSRAEVLAGVAARKALLDVIRKSLGLPVPLAEALLKAESELLRLLGAGGAVIRCGGAVFGLGFTPSLDAAERALSVLHPQVRGDIFAVDDLGLRFPDLAACTMHGSGALLLALPSAPDDAILWFRPELSRTVLWGGNPSLHDNADLAGEKHMPRRSFAAWKEMVSGRSNPWTPADLESAAELRLMIDHEMGQRARTELKCLRTEMAARDATKTNVPVEPASPPVLDNLLHLLLFDAAPDAMVVVNGAGEIRLVNLQAEKEFGYSSHELLGQPVDMLIPERFRHKHSLSRQQHAADPRIGMTAGGIEPFARRKDGGEFPVEIVLSDFATTEGLLVTAAIRNISVRKNAEKQLARIDRQNRDLLEASPDAMVMFKPNGEIVLLNLQAAAQFGYRRHELTGRNIETIMPHGLMPHADNVAARAKANGPLTPFAVPVELVGLRKNRTEFPAEITLGLAATGEDSFFTAAIRDITIRKELESYTLWNLDELKRSNEELEQFALVASHDLQEPLRMVISYTQLLGRRYKGKLDADADEFIAFAVDGALRMQKLIRDLLSYCKVETEGAPLVAASSADALQVALSNLGKLIETSGAKITSGPLPMVLADLPRISRVFQNLISNAIKYQKSDAPEVHISAERNASGKWLFSVRDNGIGIEPQYFDKIFGMFKRLHNRDEFAGTGIGLAICKKIIEHHQGTISVQSRLGEGSIFQFTLLPAGART